MPELIFLGDLHARDTAITESLNAINEFDMNKTT